MPYVTAVTTRVQKECYLDPRLRQLGSLGQFLSSVDVGVLRPLKGLFELFQLLCGERGSWPTLLPAYRQPRFTLRVAVGQEAPGAASCKGRPHWGPEVGQYKEEEGGKDLELAKLIVRLETRIKKTAMKETVEDK